MIFFVSLYWSEDLSEGFLSSHSFNLGIWSRVSAITEREKRRKNTFQAERSHHCTLPLFPYVLPLVAGLDSAQRVESRDAAYVGFFKKEHMHERPDVRTSEEWNVSGETTRLLILSLSLRSKPNIGLIKTVCRRHSH